MIRNVKGGNSTTLIALRRLGKTALIKHLFHHLRSNHLTIYLDILATESINELLNQFSAAILSQLSEQSTPGKKAWTFIRSLRPVISYDGLQGIPVVTVRSSPEESRKSIHELFSILESHSRPVVIAIDEFQQILEYPEGQTDAWLRSVVQDLKNVCFIFSGSQQHLMNELFMNPSRPFFRSTQFIKIGKIPSSPYNEFIESKFREKSRSIAPGTVQEMLDWADHYTYYVQLLCNRTFISSGKRIDPDHWKLEASRILKEQEFVFFGYRDMLTKPQWNLLKAVARDGVVKQPTSADFISRHRLGNPATVLRSLKSLQKMELIYRESDEAGIPFYGIYDVLFRRWMDRTQGAG